MKSVLVLICFVLFSCTSIQKPENKIELVLLAKSESKVQGTAIFLKKMEL